MVLLQKDTQTVGNSPRRAFGSSNWAGTGATTNRGRGRRVRVGNSNDAEELLGCLTTSVASNAELTATAFAIRIGFGGTQVVTVPPGCDLLLLSKGGANCSVTCEEMSL